MRPEGLEPPAYRFEACRSIQLSYGRPLFSTSYDSHLDCQPFAAVRSHYPLAHVIRDAGGAVPWQEQCITRLVAGAVPEGACSRHRLELKAFISGKRLPITQVKYGLGARARTPLAGGIGERRAEGCARPNEHRCRAEDDF